MTRRMRALALCFGLVLATFGMGVPAMADDGSAAAVRATKAAVALQIYNDGLRKAGRRPDYTVAPAADLLRAVFDTERFAALPEPTAQEISWLMDWAGAANSGYKQLALFGLSLQKPPDEAALMRNLQDYQDQVATAMSFNVRMMVRQWKTAMLFKADLPKERMTPIREAGFRGMRSGFAEFLPLALCTAHGMKPDNVRMLLTAIRDTQATWIEIQSPEDNARLTPWLKDIVDRGTDKDLVDSAATLMTAFATPK